MMSTYSVVLFVHSWIRWLVVGLLIAVVVDTARGWALRRAWSHAGERLHRVLVAAADLQLSLGLWLYFVASPIAAAFRANPGRAMRDPTARFFGIEHVTMMLLALTALHVGRALSKRATDSVVRHRRVFAWTLLAVALVGAGIPWPLVRAGRPLFRSPEAITQLFGRGS